LSNQFEHLRAEYPSTYFPGTGDSTAAKALDPARHQDRETQYPAEMQELTPLELPATFSSQPPKCRGSGIRTLSAGAAAL
jgi:hypothetical protein